MPTLRILAIALVAALPALAAAGTSKELILADRAGNPQRPVQVEQRDNILNIEICASTCGVFTARRVRSEDEVWDVVLLHRAFFNDRTSARSFRVKNAAHVSSVMAAYADKCSKYPQDATRATCIVKYLAKRNRIKYASVRYEGENRCEVEVDLLADSKREERGKCEGMRRRR